MMPKQRMEHKRVRRRINARREALEQDRVRHAYEIRLIRVLVRIFYEYGRLASKEYIKTQKTVDADAWVSHKLRFSLMGHYNSVFLRFAERQKEHHTKQDDSTLYESLLAQFIAENGADKIRSIEEVTRKNVKKAILKGIADGLGVDSIARRIREVNGLEGNSKRAIRRARTIARTETHNAATAANHAVARTMSIPLRKMWVSVSDSRTRSAHWEANRTKVDMEEKFLVGGELLDRPGDPLGSARNVINCRCACLYVSDEDTIT